MRLSSLLIVTFGIGALSYPAMKLPVGTPFFAERPGPQAEPVPRPTRPKTDFGLNEYSPDVAEVQRDKDYKIIVNIPATKLTLYEDSRPVLELPIAVGQAIYKTPTGRNEIKEIIWNPWWYPPKSDWAKNEKITPPGPRNPLGPVKMELSEDIRMHGTTKDNSIGSAASHGCIRMHSPDAVTLAWYIQSHLSDKTDQALLEKYKKSGSSTFRVKLNRPVPVEIVYDPVAINEGNIIIYPDLYGRVKDVKELASWKLYSHGIDPWIFDLSEVKKPTGKKAQEIKLDEIIDW